MTVDVTSLRVPFETPYVYSETFTDGVVLSPGYVSIYLGCQVNSTTLSRSGTRERKNVEEPRSRSMSYRGSELGSPPWG